SALTAHTHLLTHCRALSFARGATASTSNDDVASVVEFSAGGGISYSGLRTGGRCSDIERAAASSEGAPAPGANCSERSDILSLYSTSQGRRYVRYQATGFMACLPLGGGRAAAGLRQQRTEPRGGRPAPGKVRAEPSGPAAAPRPAAAVRPAVP